MWYVFPQIEGLGQSSMAVHYAIADLDEAIRLANDSELGLGANIYTEVLEEAFRAIHEIESGIVWVNTPLNDNDAVPFGGRKLTGSGRELGAEEVVALLAPAAAGLDPQRAFGQADAIWSASRPSEHHRYANPEHPRPPLPFAR